MSALLPTLAVAFFALGKAGTTFSFPQHCKKREKGRIKKEKSLVHKSV
jgi:hypothetical protein